REWSRIVKRYGVCRGRSRSAWGYRPPLVRSPPCVPPRPLGGRCKRMKRTAPTPTPVRAPGGTLERERTRTRKRGSLFSGGTFSRRWLPREWSRIVKRYGVCRGRSRSAWGYRPP
ncbi:unnamed protein product, partial [Ascophyllum nodosum]